VGLQEGPINWVVLLNSKFIQGVRAWRSSVNIIFLKSWPHIDSGTSLRFGKSPDIMLQAFDWWSRSSRSPEMKSYAGRATSSLHAGGEEIEG
jgi:hypothetical protein